jgi:hypothetical protein
MRRKDSAKAAQEISGIRLVQRMAAEMAVARANTAHQEAETARDKQSDRLRQDQIAWSQAVSGPSLDLHSSRFWSSEVLASQAGLREAETVVTEAGEEKVQRAGEWHAARAREDVAKDIAKSLVNGVRRRRDEAALNDLADRAAQRRTGS